MEKKNKSTGILIALIAAVIIFLLGIYCGMKIYASAIFTMYNIAKTMTIAIPVLLILLILVLVIRHKIKKRSEEKKEAKEAAMRARAQAEAKE